MDAVDNSRDYSRKFLGNCSERTKGRDPLAWFVSGFIFSIVALIAICGLPSVNRNSEKSEMNRSRERPEVERRRGLF